MVSFSSKIFLEKTLNFIIEIAFIEDDRFNFKCGSVSQSKGTYVPMSHKHLIIY